MRVRKEMPSVFVKSTNPASPKLLQHSEGGFRKQSANKQELLWLGLRDPCFSHSITIYLEMALGILTISAHSNVWMTPLYSGLFMHELHTHSNNQVALVPFTTKMAEVDRLSTSVSIRHTYFPPWFSWMLRIIRSPEILYKWRQPSKRTFRRLIV